MKIISFPNNFSKSTNLIIPGFQDFFFFKLLEKKIVYGGVWHSRAKSPFLVLSLLHVRLLEPSSD
jgi:hypothetical protein